LRPSSIIVPSRETLGPNAVNFFCDAVWYASSAMFLVLRIPNWLLVVGVVAAGAGSAFVATRTQYRPPLEAPLARRRRFGQVITSSLRIYRRHWMVFLGIGALFVPIGIIEAVLQRLIFLGEGIDVGDGFFRNDLLARGIIALTLGNVASSAGYWFVVTAGTVAISRIDTGDDAAPLNDYRIVVRRLVDLAVPRLKALGVIVLLTISVVGIPWAIRNSVRWAFIEEAILLGRVTPSQASRASGGVVEGRWWHTFACLLVLWLIGYLLGPTLGFALLLLSSASVDFVNIVSSLAFAAMAPFIAIAQALLYLDLRTARDEDGPSADRRTAERSTQPQSH